MEIAAPALPVAIRHPAQSSAIAKPIHDLQEMLAVQQDHMRRTCPGLQLQWVQSVLHDENSAEAAHNSTGFAEPRPMMRALQPQASATGSINGSNRLERV